jgi:hypothetical protein
MIRHAGDTASCDNYINLPMHHTQQARSRSIYVPSFISFIRSSLDRVTAFCIGGVSSFYMYRDIRADEMYVQGTSPLFLLCTKLCFFDYV